MDLFDYMAGEKKEKESPLASRLRPRQLSEVVGQQHILAPDKLLYRAIMADKLGSVIFYGPPGTGKTTLARVIAGTTSSLFMQINATAAGKKDMEEVVQKAKENLGMYGKKTILFIDEIHRFNKSQQDYLLPFVEDGTLTLIGATTENPYFEVNGALLSRSMIFELKPLSAQDIMILLNRAVEDREHGMGSYKAVLTEEACRFLAEVADGDARCALNALELGVLTTARAEDGLIHIDLDVARECIQRRAARYDKNADNHYDTISAFIKSMRGSDPDAAVYYLARMLNSGEDPVFIARRIMICASEDVGNADPQAIQVAVAASLASERVGMPEAQIILSQAAIYVACAPKSNAAVAAINAASELAGNTGSVRIPPYLQDAHYPGAGELGRGQGYEYAHLYRDHYAGQPCLPEDLRDKPESVLYQPSDNGYERNIRAHMSALTGDPRYTEDESLMERDQ
ncbi:MAG: replication-associated recombination protein A [Lachnospiraceae bacterium]|nr:replication-associated recombination protein A [Lachnospiraceae bacterium]